MQLLEKLISEEENLKEFIAPVVSDGFARIRVSGLIKAFKVLPATYEGFVICSLVYPAVPHLTIVTSGAPNSSAYFLYSPKK
ncbi:unnamed protein product [marine sediment metagenome]|uniref:Uncharacterized protein n=1 Tax=marine sediment metagenome TaxID=412755 RepID=X1K8P9_9ZZZZ